MTDRGCIHWADLEPSVGHEQAGRRPVLVASGSRFNASSRTVITFALTSSPPRLGFPFSALVPPGVLQKPSWVKLTQVRTIAVQRLGDRLGRVPDKFVDHCLAGLLRHCEP